MYRALFLCLAALVVQAGSALADDDAAKRANCAFLDLQGAGVIDDKTAILEYAKRDYAPPNNRLWFKVTFSNNCPRLKKARFFAINSSTCPRKGDVLTFSSRQLEREDNPDSCRIDTAEQVPVPGAQPPAN